MRKVYVMALAASMWLASAGVAQAAPPMITTKISAKTLLKAPGTLFYMGRATLRGKNIGVACGATQAGKLGCMTYEPRGKDAMLHFKTSTSLVAGKYATVSTGRGDTVRVLISGSRDLKGAQSRISNKDFPKLDNSLRGQRFPGAVWLGRGNTPTNGTTTSSVRIRSQLTAAQLRAKPGTMFDIGTARLKGKLYGVACGLGKTSQRVGCALFIPGTAKKAGTRAFASGKTSKGSGMIVFDSGDGVSLQIIMTDANSFKGGAITMSPKDFPGIDDRLKQRGFPKLR